jgi:hypothetical protein
MFGQPRLASRAIWHGALHPEPEVRRVVPLVQVGHLVDDHVFRNPGRQQITFQWKYSQSPLPHEPQRYPNYIFY